MAYEVPEAIRRRLMGAQSIGNQAIDATNLPATPGEQTEQADETPDTTTNDHQPPAVAPAPDVPPEVAVANSQTNAQAAGQEPPAAPPVERPEMANGLPVIHMPENPGERMKPSGSPPPMPPSPVSGAGAANVAPPAPPSETPGYYQQLLDSARSRDSANVNKWNLGEGLKEAFAIARGQHYGGRPYGGPLEEPGLEKDQASAQKRIADYLTRQRQGGLDALNARHTEADIALKKAETEKAGREKPATGSEDVPGLTDVLSSPAFAEKRKQFGYGTPEEIAANHGGKYGADQQALRPLPPDKEALKELRSSFEGERASEMSKDATIGAAREAAGIQRGFAKGQADEAATRALSEELAKQHIPETLATIGALRKAIDEHGGELPGVGPMAGRSLPGDIDTWFRSDEGNKYRNQVQQMQEAHRTAVTGAGAGPTELAMLNKTIISPTDTMPVFKSKLDAFEDLVQAKRRGMEAGYSGAQLDSYVGNLHAVKQREAPKAPTSHGKVVKQTKTVRQYEDGYLEEIK